MKNKVKYVNPDYLRVMECHMRAVYECGSRNALIEVYRAAKKTATAEDLHNHVIPACKERQAWLLAQGIISL